MLAACDCAEAALTHVPAGVEHPRVAIETARQWARGEATDADVRSAAHAATSAAYAANAYYAAYHAASAAATSAAYAPNAYYAAYYAAATAATAATAAYAADAGHSGIAETRRDVHARTLAESAQLVRKRITWSVVRDALEQS